MGCDQARYDVRREWGLAGLDALRRVTDVVVIGEGPVLLRSASTATP
jgi:hypothetical protein